MDVIISNYAWLLKKQLPPGGLEKIKNKFTIRPRRTHPKQDDPLSVAMYIEEDERIGIPRSYFLERRRLEHKLSFDTSDGRPLDMQFEGTLRSYQQDAVKDILRNREAGGMGGLVQAAPGWGKTVVSLGIWTKLNCSAIVIVNKSFLLRQWIKRIKGSQNKAGEIIRPGFVPGARVGIVQGSKLEYGEDYDITIAMIHTLSHRVDTLPSDFWSAFGLVITDEVHRIGAPTWGQVVPRFTAKYRLGVTATPRRKDRAENVFFWHIGEILHVSVVKRIVPRLRRIFTNLAFKSTRSWDANRASKESLIRKLVVDKERNDLITNELRYAAEKGRKIIVLSERRIHLEILEEKFKKINPIKTMIKEGREVSMPVTMAYYVGGMKEEELDISESADVIWSTYQMASEALDIPSLDTAFLVSPWSDVEQSVGRIMREFEDKEPPVISDFIDGGVPEFAKLWNKRKEFYVREGMYRPKDGD